MSIRKFRAARVNTTNANVYVGQPGDIFYDETLGQLRISDGHTAGGHLVFGAATTTKLGGIKAGPGANVSVDGTLTIDTTGIPLSVGDLFISQANISAVNPNEDLNLLTNGTGDINIVGNLHVHTTAQGPDYPTPILSANNYGNVSVNGNLITNGGTYFIGPTTFVGSITSTGTRTSQGASIFNGNVTTNGNLIVNGASYFVGNITEVGNLLITGNAVNNGHSIFNGDIVTVGNTSMIGNVVQSGNLTITGTTINNGLSVFNGNIAMVGNAVISGNTTVTGIATLTGNSYITGNTFVTGTTSVTGNLISQGGSTTILAPGIASGTAGALNIVGSADGSYMPVTGAGGMIHITGNPDTSARITVDGWTTSATDPQPATAIGAGLITLRASRGTPASPLPTKAGDHLGTIAALGKVGNNTGYSQGQTGLLFYAAEDYTSNAAVGSFANIQVVPVGSNVAVTSVQFFANGIVTGNVTAGNVTSANGQFTNINSSLQAINSNIGAFESYANLSIASITTNANANTAAYLSNGISTNIVTTGNITAGNVTANTLFHGNAVGTTATYTNTVTANTVNTGAQVITSGGIKTVIGGTPTVTLNFGTDSIVHVYQPAGAVVFQYGTLVAGATITCYINLATAQTITFGVSATNNSTDTKLGIGIGGGAPAAKNNQAVQLVYTCVDGTAANTYCVSTYT